MAQLILKYNGKIFSYCFLRSLRVEYIHSETEQKRHGIFGRLVNSRCKTQVNPPPNSSNQKNKTNFEEYSDDDKYAQVKAYIEDSVDVNGGFIDQKPAYDMIVNAWVALHLDVKVVVG